MKKVERCSFIVLLLSLSVATTPNINAQSSKIIKVSEGALRQRAIKTVIPPFPNEAKKRKAQGVAVVRLNIDERGEVTSVVVLEAPDPSVRGAVANAVGQWRFKPATWENRPVHLQGKLTFYYVIKRGKARVENPW